MGFELYCDPNGATNALWHTLWQAGQPHGMTPFGMRAMMSLRLDRILSARGCQNSRPTTPLPKPVLDRFISFRQEHCRFHRPQPPRRPNGLTPPDRQAGQHSRSMPLDADVRGLRAGLARRRGSGISAPRAAIHIFAEKSIAFALVPRAAVTDDLQAEIEILGQLRPAKRLLEPLL